MLNRVMNRQQLQSRLSQSAGVNDAAAATFLDELARIAGEELKNNGTFILPGIGILERRESPARVAKNPATGETINLRAKVNLKFEIASRLRHAVLATHSEREGMLTTSLWKVSRPVLEALARDGSSAKEWNTLDPKGHELDGDFTALLDEYSDLFAYILKTEGFLDEATLSGLTVGYVTPETLQTRVADLRSVSLETLEQSGSVPPQTAQQSGEALHKLKDFLADSTIRQLGLIVVTYF